MDVLHPSRPNVSRADLSEKLAALYKTNKERVVTFGLRTHFGGGRSTGFALIYDDEASQKKFEPKYRLVRVSYMCCDFFCHLSRSTIKSGLASKVEKPSRKLRKERKNRAKKVIFYLFGSLCGSDFFHKVPRHEKGQGGGASQEGQVNVGRPLSPCFVWDLHVFIITLCMPKSNEHANMRC